MAISHFPIQTLPATAANVAYVPTGNITATNVQSAISQIASSYAIPLNFYVATTGSDTTGDGSSGNPWRTTAFACDFLRQNYRTGTNRSDSTASIIINVAAGTYTDKVYLDYLFNVQIVGAGASTTIFDAVHNGIFRAFGPCYAYITGVTVQNTGAPGTGVGFYTNWDGATFFIADVTCGTGLARHISAESVSRIVINGASQFKITGGANNFAFCGSNSFIDITGGAHITITGTPNFADCFIWATDNATVFVEPDTIFTGSATGKRFRVSNGGDIATSATGALGDTNGLTFLPGNAAGEGWAGGNYDSNVYLGDGIISTGTLQVYNQQLIRSPTTSSGVYFADVFGPNGSTPHFGYLRLRIDDATGGTEDATWRFGSITNGVHADTLTFSQTFASFGIAAFPNFANDAAAAAGGVAIGQFYRNGSIVMVRVA